MSSPSHPLTIPTSSLESIPVEILALICEYVGLSHRPSLLAFALASKSCHCIAKRLFFHTIRFSAISQDQLEQDVDECIRILTRNASFSHVRTLLITGADWDEREGPGLLISTYDGDAPSWSFGLPLSLSEIVDGDKDRLQGLLCHSALVPIEPPDMSPDDDDDNVPLADAAWQPLACLVQILQGLGDVLYASPDQVPPCLLQALLQYQPRCRLHVFTFTLRSLGLPETDPGELALMTAPCLYSIWMWYYDTYGFGDDGEPAYHAEAIDSILTLDASPPPWFRAAPPREHQNEVNRRALVFDTAIDPCFDDLDSQYLSGSLFPYRHGHIRDVFINTAVDETLARAIFTTICAAKAAAYGHSAALALNRMVIKPERGRSFPQRPPMMSGTWGLRAYMTVLGRHWLLERDVRDDVRHMIRAQEIGWKERLLLVPTFTVIRGPEHHSYMEYMPIFRRIWPEKPGVSADWYDDWHSWPLEETA